MDYDILKELGLGEIETKVYLALLTLGSAQAGEINKKAEINRTNVYDALERLISKGLVTYVYSSNRKIFEPANPIRLKELLKEKEEKLDEIIDKLVQRYDSSKIKEDATIYKGKKGVKYVLELLLKDTTEILSYGAQGKFSETYPIFREIWEAKRIRAKIKKRIIYNELIRKQRLKEKQKFAELRFLSKEYDFPSTILISGNRTATIVWGEQPIAFLINSSAVTQSNKNFFELLWNIAKK